MQRIDSVQTVHHFLAEHRRGTLMVVTLAVCTIAAYALLYSPVPARSVEASFADALPRGLEIVPASCASPPPTAPSNGAGYQLPNGTSNDQISADGISFCITNSGGPDYFVPLNTAAEVQYFNTAVGAGLPGLSY